MVSVIIGRTNKPINSTSKTFADSTSLSCRLKEPCSQQSPVFIVQGLSKTVYYNYAQLMNHYYWIDDIVWNTNDIQEIHCHLDPLATYKDAIDNSYAFVQYGAKGMWNKYVDDARFAPESRAPEADEEGTFKCIPGITSPSNGYVVMKYMDCGNGGGVKCIAMTLTAFGSMLDDLSNIFNASTTIGEITAAMGGQGSWRDNILSCIYVPTDHINKGSHVSQIRLGGVTCNVSGYMQAAVVTANEVDYDTIVINPTASYFTNCPFMKNSRWISFQISTPFGCTEIPFDIIKPTITTKLYVSTCMDVTTGDTTIKITDAADGLGTVLAAFSGNVGVNMMDILGSAMTFGKGLGNSLVYGGKLALNAFSLGVSMGTSAITAARPIENEALMLANRKDNPISDATFNRMMASAKQAGINASITSGIDGIASSIPTGVGGSGVSSGPIGSGFSSLYLTTTFGTGYWCLRVYKPLSTLDYQNFCDRYGYPVNDYLKLSDTPGWTKCSGASVQNCLGASEANISTINSYLNSGIILEA